MSEQEPKSIEHIESVEGAVEVFLDGEDTDAVVAYLREHKRDEEIISEFCLQVKEKYQPNDPTPLLLLAKLLQGVL